MLLKYTSLTIHARHVFLSSDLTELVWSMNEDGRIHMGRNKSLLLSEIDNIVVGVQPSRFQSNATKHVSATASRLSEKLTFRVSTVDNAINPPHVKKQQAPLPRNRKSNQSDDDQSQVIKSSILSRLFKDDKDHKKRTDAGLEKSIDRISENGSVENTSTRVKYKRDGRGSDRGSEISSMDEFPVHSRNRYFLSIIVCNIFGL
jgi:hypothetical protein